jgi:hypothetical protein
MKTSDMIQSPFLKKEDFATPTILTIKRVSLEQVVKGEEKWVLFFNEKTKGLVLNKTKIKLLEGGYGDDTDLWIGKKVRLSFDPTVAFGGETVGGVKLEVSKGASKPATPAPAPAAPVVPVTPAGDFQDDSDIPF